MSVTVTIAMVSVMSIAINDNYVVVVVVPPLVHDDNIVAVSVTMSSVMAVVSTIPINDNDVASLVDVRVDMRVDVVAIFNDLGLVIVSVRSTFNDDNSVVVVSRRSSIEVDQRSVNGAIASNTIEVNVDELRYQPGFISEGGRTHVVSGIAIGSGIQIDQSTMSRTIAPDSVDVDIDHLSSQLGSFRTQTKRHSRPVPSMAWRTSSGSEAPSAEAAAGVGLVPAEAAGTEAAEPGPEAAWVEREDPEPRIPSRNHREGYHLAYPHTRLPEPVPSDSIFEQRARYRDLPPPLHPRFALALKALVDLVDPSKAFVLAAESSRHCRPCIALSS
jgi:hypothetical protein